MSNKKTSPKSGSRLNMNGIHWTPAARDIAHSIIRTYGQVKIVGLPGPLLPVGFINHPALDAWSEEQLKPKAVK